VSCWLLMSQIDADEEICGRCRATDVTGFACGHWINSTGVRERPITNGSDSVAADALHVWLARVPDKESAMSNAEKPNSDAPMMPPDGEVVDRRSGIDRRDLSSADSAASNLERRRGPGRRRTDFMRSAEEGEMTNEQFLFIMAIDTFKRVNGKTFPTWTDVLEVIRKLGYRKTQSSELNLGRRAEDWTERADAPSGVDKEAPAEEASPGDAD